MMHQGFRNAEESHAHSLQTLQILEQYADFLESVGTVADMGCGEGLDLEWWATRTTQEDNPQPLNIKCTGIDLPFIDQSAICWDPCSSSWFKSYG